MKWRSCESIPHALLHSALCENGNTGRHLSKLRSKCYDRMEHRCINTCKYCNSKRPKISTKTSARFEIWSKQVLRRRVRYHSVADVKDAYTAIESEISATQSTDDSLTASMPCCRHKMLQRHRHTMHGTRDSTHHHRQHHHAMQTSSIIHAHNAQILPGVFTRQWP